MCVYSPVPCVSCCTGHVVPRGFETCHNQRAEHLSVSYGLHVEGSCGSFVDGYTRIVAEHTSLRQLAEVDNAQETCLEGRMAQNAKFAISYFLYYSYTIYSATQTAAILDRKKLAFAERLGGLGSE